MGRKSTEGSRRTAPCRLATANLKRSSFPGSAPWLPHTLADLPSEPLAILRGEHEVVVQGIHRVGGSPQFVHGRPLYRKPPKGEGFT
jgi:hypothetical protein